VRVEVGQRRGSSNRWLAPATPSHTGNAMRTAIKPAGVYFLRLSLGALLIAHPASAVPSVLTQHNDNNRSGANLQEVILTPSNVASGVSINCSRAQSTIRFMGSLYMFPT
jgi:hypothetical protein